MLQLIGIFRASLKSISASPGRIDEGDILRENNEIGEDGSRDRVNGSGTKLVDKLETNKGEHYGKIYRNMKEIWRIREEIEVRMVLTTKKEYDNI